VTERRLRVAALPLGGGAVTLDDVASRHVRVLRLRPGDRVQLFDGRGMEAEAELQSIDGQATCVADAPIRVGAKGPRLVLVLGLPKGGALDECVRMATELGVGEIVLLRAHRSVPRWDARRAASRVARLTRIASEAAAQCERADIPAIRTPATLDEVLATVPQAATAVVFGARAQGGFHLSDIPEQVWCAVGPEGGFNADELAAFEAAGFELASLGPTVLRVDTAVAAALTVIGDRVRSLQAR
jgi:16S rRNA (uracil1498-N3)-methyltransferase